MGCPSSSNYVGSYEQIHVTGFPCKWSWPATKELEKKSTNASPDSLVPLGAFFGDFVGRSTGDRFGLEKNIVFMISVGYEMDFNAPGGFFSVSKFEMTFRICYIGFIPFVLPLPKGFHVWCFQKGGNSMGSTWKVRWLFLRETLKATRGHRKEVNIWNTNEQASLTGNEYMGVS